MVYKIRRVHLCDIINRLSCGINLKMMLFCGIYTLCNMVAILVAKNEMLNKFHFSYIPYRASYWRWFNLTIWSFCPFGEN